MKQSTVDYMNALPKPGDGAGWATRAADIFGIALDKIAKPQEVLPWDDEQDDPRAEHYYRREHDSGDMER